MSRQVPESGHSTVPLPAGSRLPGPHQPLPAPAGPSGIFARFSRTGATTRWRRPNRGGSGRDAEPVTPRRRNRATRQGSGRVCPGSSAHHRSPASRPFGSCRKRRGARSGHHVERALAGIRRGTHVLHHNEGQMASVCPLGELAGMRVLDIDACHHGLGWNAAICESVASTLAGLSPRWRTSSRYRSRTVHDPAAGEPAGR